MITVALIGTGRWGTKYIEEIEKIKDFSLKYICSPHVISKHIASPNYTRVTDYRELLSKKIDAIIIATPAETHFFIASQFLQEGFNVLIEKPLTTNYKDALELKRIVDKQHTVVMIGHLYHYNNAFQKTKELLPKIGKISYLYFEAGKFWPNRDDASSLWEWAPHDVAMTLELLQKMPLRVAAWATWKGDRRNKIHDMVHINMTFSENVHVFIRVGWSFPKKTRELTIVGSNAMIRYDELNKKKIFLLHYDSGSKKEFPEFVRTSPLRDELFDFLMCIKKSKVPTENIDKAIDIVKILHLAEKSIESNGKEYKIA